MKPLNRNEHTPLEVAKAIALDFERAGFDGVGRPDRKTFVHGAVVPDLIGVNVELRTATTGPPEFWTTRGIDAYAAQVLVTVRDGNTWVDYLDPEDVVPYIKGVVAATRVAAT